MDNHLYPQATTADIALILEGSYPFVRGGVSEWVHQIIQNFPHYTFALIFLGSKPENYKEGLRYQLPANVTHLQVNYLFAKENVPITRKALTDNAQDFAKMTEIHQAFRHMDQDLTSKVSDLNACPYQKTGMDYSQFLYSKSSWDFITDQYTQHCTDPSFVDYFWTVRSIHKPLWETLRVVHTIPKVKIIHTISTGYAGFLATLIHHHYHYPLILTEHGIYTKERHIDILQSEIFREYDDFAHSITESSYLSELWNRCFATLARLCYQAANPIVSLFNVAHQLQLDSGAAIEKSVVIPNGIHITRFKKLRCALIEKLPVIGFIGRVVPIKDVKGFIRAIASVHNQISDIKAWIIGATDEDPEYVRECHELVENLSLQDTIEFKAHQSVDDIFPKIKLLVLSSISEGMPLVILESFAAGVPVVATDVGSCRELIVGRSAEDQKIGASGKVVKIADPYDLAQAIIHLLTDQQSWQQASEAAIQRVEQFYDQKTMIAQYKEIYARSM